MEHVIEHVKEQTNNDKWDSSTAAVLFFDVSRTANFRLRLRTVLFSAYNKSIIRYPRSTERSQNKGLWNKRQSLLFDIESKNGKQGTFEKTLSEL